MREHLSQIDQVVSVGSVDGICTTAALLFLIDRGDDVGLQFTQAFTVNKVDIAKWPEGQKVAFVDLAVNNRDKTMTADFVHRIREAGHEIVAVIDEHCREDWEEALGSFDGLIVEPQSQKVPGAPQSSGELLLRWLHAQDVPEEEMTDADLCEALDNPEDSYLMELLESADKADHMDFTTYYGGFVNKATKSDMGNDSRRVYLARHFAANPDPDATILGWVAEYEEIMHNHREIIAAKVDLGNGIARVVTTGKKVDMTTLMNTLYHGGGDRSFFHGDCAKVVVLEGEQFNKAAGCKIRMVSFGAADKDLDLLTPVKAVVPTASGFASKVNVDLKDEQAALAAIREALHQR